MSERVKDIPPFYVMEILESAKALEAEGEDVIHLEVGEPDFPTPEVITEAGVRALRDGRTHYTHSLGLRELREAICERIRVDCGREVSPDRVLVTSGTSPALLLTFAALCDPGDQVILTDPHYACYPNFLRALSVEIVRVPVRADDGYALDPEAVRAAITPRTKALLINSPANPTGAVLSDENVAALCELGVSIVSDEIYRGLEYGTASSSVMRFTEDAVMLDGFSKRYAMTGWRLGYLVAPERLTPPLRALQQNLFISAADFTQHAGLAALRHGAEAAEAMRQEFERRRRVMVDGVRSLGLEVTREPQGAFYVLAKADHLGPWSLAVARRILREAKVAVTPGVDFGPGAEGFLRFSYTNSVEAIEEGVRRLRKLLAGW